MKNMMTTHFPKSSAKGKQGPRLQPARILFLSALSIVGLAAQVPASYAQEAAPSVVQPAVTVSNLSGLWTISLGGVTGCGQATMRALATLGSTGKASGVSMTSHTANCGDGTTSQTFTITALTSDGRGTAHLSCGDGCGWDFDIEVASGNNVMSLVDVTNSENFLEGTAIREQ